MKTTIKTPQNAVTHTAVERNPKQQYCRVFSSFTPLYLFFIQQGLSPSPVFIWTGFLFSKSIINQH